MYLFTDTHTKANKTKTIQHFRNCGPRLISFKFHRHPLIVVVPPHACFASFQLGKVGLWPCNFSALNLLRVYRFSLYVKQDVCRRQRPDRHTYISLFFLNSIRYSGDGRIFTSDCVLIRIWGYLELLNDVGWGSFVFRFLVGFFFVVMGVIALFSSIDSISLVFLLTFRTLLYYCYGFSQFLGLRFT